MAAVSQYLEELGDTWGPSKLAKGMGGANEAVIFVSRQLAALGYRSDWLPPFPWSHWCATAL